MMDELKTELLKQIKGILEDQTTSSFERLCNAACVFLAAVAEVELAEREAKKIKGKGR